MVFEDAYVMPFVNCFVMMMKMKMRETRDFGPLVCLVHPQGGRPNPWTWSDHLNLDGFNTNLLIIYIYFL